MGVTSLEKSMKPVMSRNGFTLIEVLMAMLVLLISFLGLISMSTTAIRRNAAANKMTIATILAQDKLEEIRNTPYSGIYYYSC
ncbi:prepilin-type N-terminal cleavage/methylation domain-containing protein [Nitrospira defluvii]|nr:prepilin-type N-terminal cleavage/methylation domain-containing protein [Nitrospira defluvii]